jgi:hypothetical protein
MPAASLPEKQNALTTLIRQSLLIDQSRKKELIAKIPKMGEEAIDALGGLLSEEVTKAQEFYKTALPQLDALIQELDNPKQ